MSGKLRPSSLRSLYRRSAVQSNPNHSSTSSTKRVLALALLAYYYLLVVPLQWWYGLISGLVGTGKEVTWWGFCELLRMYAWVFQRIAVRFYAKWMVRTYLPQVEVTQAFGPSISFGGGGMLWSYYLGVGHFVYKNYDISQIKFLASSGGCFAAVPLSMGLDPYSWCRKDWPHCLDHFVSRPMGCFLDSCDFYTKLWDNYLPPDAHIRASGRLFLSMTLFPSFKNKVVSQFDNRADLISCIIASTCLPIVFLRDIPRTPFGLAIDAGVTNDQPCIDRYTLTVSVLNEEADLVPSTVFGVLDLIRVPSLNEAFRTARKAEKDASRCEVWDRAEWVRVRRRDLALTPAMTPKTGATVKERRKKLNKMLHKGDYPFNALQLMNKGVFQSHKESLDADIIPPHTPSMHLVYERNRQRHTTNGYERRREDDEGRSDESGDDDLPHPDTHEPSSSNTSDGSDGEERAPPTHDSHPLSPVLESPITSTDTHTGPAEFRSYATRSTGTHSTRSAPTQYSDVVLTQPPRHRVSGSTLSQGWSDTSSAHTHTHSHTTPTTARQEESGRYNVNHDYEEHLRLVEQQYKQYQQQQQQQYQYQQQQQQQQQYQHQQQYQQQHQQQFHHQQQQCQQQQQQQQQRQQRQQRQQQPHHQTLSYGADTYNHHKPHHVYSTDTLSYGPQSANAHVRTSHDVHSHRPDTHTHTYTHVCPYDGHHTQHPHQQPQPHPRNPPPINTKTEASHALPDRKASSGYDSVSVWSDSSNALQQQQHQHQQQQQQYQNYHQQQQLPNGVTTTHSVVPSSQVAYTSFSAADGVPKVPTTRRSGSSPLSNHQSPPSEVASVDHRRSHRQLVEVNVGSNPEEQIDVNIHVM